jgi:glycosyltransferase involved in cell wall biosynthesis
MKIFLPNINSLSGGPKTFFSGFSQFLKFKEYSLKKRVYFGVPFRKITTKETLVIMRVNGLRCLFPFTIKDSFFKRFYLRIINYPLYRRIIKSNGIVFQSDTSIKIWQWFYPEVFDYNIPYIVQHNGLLKKNKIKFNNTKIVFSFANWRPNLCLSQTIETFNYLAEKDPNIEFRIYGHSYSLYQRWFYKTIARINNPRIRFMGKLKEGDLNNLAKSSSIMLTLDYFAICPNATLESLSFGMPVIGPKSMGLIELIPNQFLFEINFNPFDYGTTLFEFSQPKFDIRLIASMISDTFDNYSLNRSGMRLNKRLDFKDKVYENYFNFIKKISDTV